MHKSQVVTSLLFDVRVEGVSGLIPLCPLHEFNWGFAFKVLGLLRRISFLERVVSHGMHSHGGPMQRSPFPFVHHIHIGTGSYQACSHIPLRIDRKVVRRFYCTDQGRRTILYLLIQVVFLVLQLSDGCVICRVVRSAGGALQQSKCTNAASECYFVKTLPPDNSKPVASSGFPSLSRRE